MADANPTKRVESFIFFLKACKMRAKLLGETAGFMHLLYQVEALVFQLRSLNRGNVGIFARYEQGCSVDVCALRQLMLLEFGMIVSGQ